MKKKSILLIILFIVVFFAGVFVVYSAFNELSQNSQIEKEIESLKREAEKIQKNNTELREKIAYFETPEFQERIAKEKLNLQKEGENVVIVKHNSSSREEFKENTPSQNHLSPEIPNWKKWWRYFFKKSD